MERQLGECAPSFDERRHLFELRRCRHLEKLEDRRFGAHDRAAGIPESLQSALVVVQEAGGDGVVEDKEGVPGAAQVDRGLVDAHVGLHPHEDHLPPVQFGNRRKKSLVPRAAEGHLLDQTVFFPVERSQDLRHGPAEAFRVLLGEEDRDPERPGRLERDLHVPESPRIQILVDGGDELLLHVHDEKDRLLPVQKIRHVPPFSCAPPTLTPSSLGVSFSKPVSVTRYVFSSPTAPPEGKTNFGSRAKIIPGARTVSEPFAMKGNSSVSIPTPCPMNFTLYPGAPMKFAANGLREAISRPISYIRALSTR